MMITSRPRRGCAAGLALALLGAAAAGCQPVRTPWAAPSGPATQAIWVAGLRRTFDVYRPPRLTTPAPLVVMLHGGSATAAQAERSYGWDAEAGTGATSSWSTRTG